MKANVTYCITYYTNLGLVLAGGIASNHICAYVGDSTMDTILSSRGKVINYFTPQVQCNAVVSDTQNWVKEEASFVANGTETNIILGNFYYDYQTAVYVFNANGGRFTEYFIDDISVVETNAKIRAGNDTTINEDDTVILGKGITEGLPCDWFTASGTPVYSGSTPTITPTKTTTYVVKMDLCGSISTDTMTVFVIPTGMEQLTNNAHLLIYPNPCKNNLKISQFENLKMFEVFDLLGSLKLTPAAIPPSKGARGMFEIEVSNLPAGIYFLKATDDKGFQRTTKFVKE